MFSSKRKSRPNGPMLPPSDPGNVSKNALAAASAIGQAIKTGTPIPRSNSLQRTTSLQRNSHYKVSSRSSSLMGLQGPPPQFQEHGTASPRAQRQPTQHKSTPQRSQSFNTASHQNRARIQSAQAGTPRMVKKHIPGPYGLITIEVPAEESSSVPVRKPTQRRTQSLVKPKPSFSEISSGRSRTSSNASSKRPMFVDDLPEVDEYQPLEFEQHRPDNQPLPVPSPKNKNLTFIEEEDTEYDTALARSSPSLEEPEKVEGIDEFENLKMDKEKEEEKMVDSLQKEEIKEQELLSEKSDLSAPAAIANQKGASSDFENDVLDQYTDLPSTAKSTDTLAAGQSSITTADSELVEKDYHSSMAQQLRPTIPALYVNNRDAPGVSPQSFSNDVNSSIYSENSGEEADVPSRSEKRNDISPRKSALKYKTGASNSNLALQDSNPASQAYLSLATAENTRMNAMSSNHSSTSLSRSASRIMVDKPLNGRVQQHHAGNGAMARPQPLQQQAQQHQYLQNGPPPRSQLRNGNTVPPRPQSAIDSPSRGPYGIPRPQSVQSHRPQSQQTQNPQNFRPQSAQGFRQAAPQPAYGRTSRPQQRASVPKSASNAAALNATLKKNEQLRPQLEKKSSFEKDRPHDAHSAFKRKSLRDPSFGAQPHNFESNLGFYRHQAQQNKQHSAQAAPPPQQNFPQALDGFSSNFKSRFNDSDSDNDVPVGNGPSNPAKMFAPPPSNPALRKPKSTFTLRSSSVTGLPKNSPAKSLPEKRATRYFSESDKEKLFNEHLEKVKREAGQEKKKSTFGKLKKLFGRSSKD